MNRQKLFVASCVSLVTTSMVFAIRGDVAPAMSAAFQLTNEQMGLIFSPAFWAFTIAIFISGALVDAVGMRALRADAHPRRGVSRHVRHRGSPPHRRER